MAVKNLGFSVGAKQTEFRTRVGVVAVAQVGIYPMVLIIGNIISFCFDIGKAVVEADAAVLIGGVGIFLEGEAGALLVELTIGIASGRKIALDFPVGVGL